MSNDEERLDFSQSGGHAFTYTVQCSSLRRNGHVVIKNRPCKIVDVLTTADEYGDVYVKLVAIDIFTGNKLEDLSPSTHNMNVPNVSRNELQLVNIDEGFLNLMTNDGSPKDDVKQPQGDLGHQMVEDFNGGKDLIVTVVSAMGEDVAVAYKEAPKN
ncbi:Eukaryotic translation initiation factor 5A [Mortierella polycephala]|uniref:Eukaryotic translation initiation factor 5A n=1 Tax=Mortierella polycephala TaxID=41804 RepID=A0A9P6TV97_9FUNG|nr:Eukaryotic translation initiation factor 5A [Mortierella polycephala]